MRHRLVNLAGLAFLATFVYAAWTVVTSGQGWPRILVRGRFRDPESAVVQGQTCVRPKMDVMNPLVSKYLKKVPRLKCSEETDWLKLAEGRVSFDGGAVRRHGNLTCRLDVHQRLDDYQSKVGQTVTLGSEQEGAPLTGDFFEAQCKAKDGATWNNVMAGVHRKRPAAVSAPSGGEPKWNVLMFGMDSMSRLHFMRKMPKTYALLTKQMDAVVFEGYNIVGDGTPQALIPILTGFTEVELPDTRKRNQDSHHVNVYPWVWNNFSSLGYVTAFAEDTPNVGIFTYRLNGFKEQPTDHYMRPFYVEAAKQFHKHKKLCLGSQSRHQVMLNWLRQFYEVYRDLPKFAFGFHGELSHDDFNLSGVGDLDLADFIAGLRKAGLLEDTFLLIMSDHGHRYSNMRTLAQGKQEERLPFLSVTAPKSFRDRHPDLFDNLKANGQQLTSPFDLNPTFHSLLDPSKVPPVGDLSQRAISLFSKIPPERTCAQAGIEPHWCTCLSWESVPADDPASREASQSVVDFINQYTSEQESACARLTLDEVTRSEKYRPAEALLSYKGVLDADGFVPDLTDSVQAQHVIYAVQFSVHPSGGVYEASVVLDSKALTFRVDLKDISRVNEYGRQPHCVQDQLPQLMKYCYCKVQLAT